MKECIYVLNYNDGKVYRIDVDDTKTDKIEIADKVR